MTNVYPVPSTHDTAWVMTCAMESAHMSASTPGWIKLLSMHARQRVHMPPGLQFMADSPQHNPACSSSFVLHGALRALSTWAGGVRR